MNFQKKSVIRQKIEKLEKGLKQLSDPPKRIASGRAGGRVVGRLGGRAVGRSGGWAVGRLGGWAVGRASGRASERSYERASERATSEWVSERAGE